MPLQLKKEGTMKQIKKIVPVIFLSLMSTTAKAVPVVPNFNTGVLQSHTAVSYTHLTLPTT